MNLYPMDVPSFLIPYMHTKAMERLQGIDMNCGMNFTSFPLFKHIQPYSRYEHSVDTALLAWHFSQNKVVAIASLFHDIATPAFSHTIDFMHGDYQKQESTEDLTEKIISSDADIMKQLEEDHISVKEVSNYHMYPLADNDTPRLSCDRLEYTLHNAVNYGFSTINEIHSLLEDTDIDLNEDGIEEICFRREDKAERFTELALLCGKVYSSKEDRYGMERLSEILKQAVSLHILKEEDFMMDEACVINKLENSTLKDRWLSFTHLSKITVTDTYEEGSISLVVKKRWIDPLIKDSVRISHISDTLNRNIHGFLSDDMHEYLKGDTL